jgi:hypothetical protein
VLDAATVAMPLYSRQLIETRHAREERDQWDAQHKGEAGSPPAPSEAGAGAGQFSRAEVLAPGRNQNAPRHRPKVARIATPSVLVLAVRASELLMQLAPMIHEMVEQLIDSGINPKPFMKRAAAEIVAQTFIEELGIDLADIANADAERLRLALEIVAQWVRDVRKYWHDEDSGHPPRPPTMRMPTVRAPSVNVPMPRMPSQGMIDRFAQQAKDVLNRPERTLPPAGRDWPTT